MPERAVLQLELRIRYSVAVVAFSADSLSVLHGIAHLPKSPSLHSSDLGGQLYVYLCG